MAFPAWISKTIWRKMNGAKRQNACVNMRAICGLDVGMAGFRGIVTNPSWLKGEPGPGGRADIYRMEASARRKLSREGKEHRQRSAELAKCEHQEWSIGPNSRACTKCGTVQLFERKATP